MTERDDDGFLSRWSKRKRDTRAGLAEDDSAKGATVAVESERPADLVPAGEGGFARDPETDPEIPEELADIDIDKLDYESDFTVFMKENVPDVLKRQALRQLWRSNPILANIDGLNDYDADFSDAATVLKGMQSAYQVGKGYFTGEEEPEADADAAETGTSEHPRAQASSPGGDGPEMASENAETEETSDETRPIRLADGSPDAEAQEPDPFEADETEDV